MRLASAGASLRSRARWVQLSGVGLALAAAGCALEPDVVAEPDRHSEADVAAEPSEAGPSDAELSDAGAWPLAPTKVDAGLTVPRTGLRDAGPDALASDALAAPDALAIAQNCTSAFVPVMLASKLGRLYRYDPRLGSAEDYGVPTCLQNGIVRSATLDKNGNVWVSWASDAPDALYAIEPGTSCGMPLLVSRRFDAMAFVHTSQGSTLYALEAGQLVAVDPDSLEVRSVGELNTRHLVADPWGSLFAVRQDEQGTVHIDEIDLADAGVRPVWTSQLPASSLAGAARSTQEGMWLFSFTRLYQLDWATGETKDVGPITDVELDVATVAASSCEGY